MWLDFKLCYGPDILLWKLSLGAFMLHIRIAAYDHHLWSNRYGVSLQWPTLRGLTSKSWIGGPNTAIGNFRAEQWEAARKYEKGNKPE